MLKLLDSVFFAISVNFMSLYLLVILWILETIHMFINDKTIDNLQVLFSEVKHYINLQKDYVKLDITYKLVVLLSTLILILILMVLGMIALFYLSFTLAYILEHHVGGLMNSYAIITGVILLLGILIYCFRQRLIIQPLTNFLANLILNDQ